MPLSRLVSAHRARRARRARRGWRPSTYADRWRSVWTLVAVSGAGVAGLEWSPLLAVVAVLFAWAGAAALLVSLSVAREGVPEQPLGRRPHTVAVDALLLGTATVAAFAIGSVSSALLLLLLLLGAVTSPVVVRRVRRAVRPLSAVDRRLRTLSDLELCDLWRYTFDQLRSRPPAETLLGLVGVRQACLDELARRDPAAVAAWLESGARPEEGPDGFRAGEQGRAA